jgi:putative MFS transporter
MTSWQRRLAVLIGVGSFFNFMEVALGSLLVPLIGEQWSMTTFEQSALLAATFIGEAIGSLLLAPLADRFGRSRMFQVNLVLYAIFSVAAAFAPGVAALIALRICLGVGLGGELTLVDSYLTETMPARGRGRVLAYSYTLGLFAAPLTGLATVLLPATIGGVDGWRVIMVSAAVGAVVLWKLRRRLPESPRWLIAHGRIDEAAKIVAALPPVLPPVREPLAVAGREHPPVVEPALPGPPRASLARRRTLVYAMNVIGPIGFYGFATIAPLVLVDKGYSVVDSLGYSALSAIGYPVGSVVSALLAERMERRTLLAVSTFAVAAFGLAFGLAGSPGMIVASGFLTGLASVVQSNLSHIYSAELFPTAVRAREIGRPYSLSRVIGAALPFAALPALHAFGAGALYSVCAALVALLGVTVLVLGPRTNRKSLERI